MRKTSARVPLAAVLVSLVALASAGGREVLVGTDSTAITRSSTGGAVELQNLGPNPIYCTLGSVVPVVGKGHLIQASGGTWAIRYSGAIHCICGTAQVTTAATWVTELQ